VVGEPLVVVGCVVADGSVVVEGAVAAGSVVSGAVVTIVDEPVAPSSLDAVWVSLSRVEVLALVSSLGASVVVEAGVVLPDAAVLPLATTVEPAPLEASRGRLAADGVRSAPALATSSGRVVATATASPPMSTASPPANARASLVRRSS